MTGDWLIKVDVSQSTLYSLKTLHPQSFRLFSWGKRPKRLRKDNGDLYEQVIGGYEYGQSCENTFEAHCGVKDFQSVVFYTIVPVTMWIKNGRKQAGSLLHAYIKIICIGADVSEAK